MRYLQIILLVLALPVASLVTNAAVKEGATIGIAATQVPASQLGQKLTKFGAIKAGTPNGRIPAYTGGLTKIPNSFKPGSGVYPDPFKDEKPLFVVTSENLDKYKDEISRGVQQLFKLYPNFKMPVYPTHRTARYPKWVLKNTLANAKTAKLAKGGLGVIGAYGGVPFPIPHNGSELLWNAMMAYQGTYTAQKDVQALLVDSSGHYGAQSTITNRQLYQYYNKKREELDGNFYYRYSGTVSQPPSLANFGIMRFLTINYNKTDSLYYVYNPAQRRVRVAPRFQYDTPVALEGGAVNYDESKMFNGNPVKFNWEILGKKALLVPYNEYRISLPAGHENAIDPDSLFQPHIPNPEYIRWELHRVWILQGNLKPDARHVYKTRRYYIDEDSWVFLLGEEYDHAGELNKVGIDMVRELYDAPLMYYNTYFWINLKGGNYVLVNYQGLESSKVLHNDSVQQVMPKFRPQFMTHAAY